MTPTTNASAALAESPAVQRWFASARYDEDPAEEQQARLSLLARFCERQGQTPDGLVAGCLRTTKSGDTAISAKGRNAIQEAIDEFVTSVGLTGREAVINGNMLRGFLIHNGVFIQGPVWRG
jgi:hypothetical protein